ncbi:MAG: DinB family protein [Saprospiraceae bacterium]|nr:DinB family protein [Saprospiraceae bacterium]
MEVTIQKWITEINEANAAFQKEFAGLTSEQRNTRPSKGGWSINEIVVHVITVNESYWPIFDLVAKGKYVHSMMGNFAFFRNLFGKMILKSVQPDEPKKQKTLPIWQPKLADDAVDTLALLSAHCQQMIQRLVSIEGQVKRNVTIASPANDLIVYDIQTALDIIVAHMNRHRQQATRTAKAIMVSA